MKDYIEYLTIPYLHQGRTIKGADCFGLLRLFYKNELNIDLPDFTEDYDQEWWKTDNFMLDLYKEYNFKKVKDIQPNDVILFKNNATNAGHIGIVLDDSNFIHMSRTGCGTANYLYGIWQRQIHSVYRYKNTRKKK